MTRVWYVPVGTWTICGGDGVHEASSLPVAEPACIAEAPHSVISFLWRLRFTDFFLFLLM